MLGDEITRLRNKLMFVSHVIRKLALKRKLRSWKRAQKKSLRLQISPLADSKQQKKNQFSVGGARTKRKSLFGIDANLKVHAVVVHRAIKINNDTKIG